MRSIIFEKVNAFINDERERMNKEIEEKRQQLEEQKEERRENVEKKQQELEQKQQILKDMRKKSRAYKDEAERIKGNKMLKEGYRFYLDKNKELKGSIYELNKEVNALEKECQSLKFEYEDFIIEDDEVLKELVNGLNEFDNTYGKIDFTSENGVYNIETIIGRQEEKETSRMSDGQVYNENNEPVDDMEEIKKMQKQQILKEKIDQRFAEIEKGFEDLLIAPYIKAKENIKKEDNLEEALEDLQSMDLKDIYAEGLTYFEEGSPEAEELKNVIKLVKEREKEIEAQGTKQGGVKPGVPKPEGAKPKGAKPEGAQPKGTQPKATVKDCRVIDSNGREIDNIETIRAMQERQILEEELEQRLQEIKAGNEDLVNDSYLLLEQDLRDREDIENVLESLEGKTIKDIYEGMLEQAKTPEEKEELEGIISELDAREAQLINQEQAQEQEHEQILTKIEQKIIEWETGNEDLLLPIYSDYIDFYIEKSSEDYDYAKQMLEYFEGTNLSGFYKDILDAISKEEEPSEEDITDIEDIKNIVAKLAERDKHRIKSTTIVIEPYRDLIQINIKGRPKTIALKNILELTSKGKELQEGELISKFGVNRCNPAILEALTEIGEKYPIHKDLIDEYINTFSDGKTDKIDDIIYYFNEGEKNKADNYKKIVSACKKYAKADAKYGMATIEKTGKKGIIDRLKGLGIKIESFFINQNQKRLESKEAKEYRTSRLKRFKEKNEDIEEPVKKRDPKAFMKKMQEKAKKSKSEEIDMSEAIEKLQAINQEMNDQPVVKEEEEVL